MEGAPGAKISSGRPKKWLSFGHNEGGVPQDGSPHGSGQEAASGETQGTFGSAVRTEVTELGGRE